MAAPRTRGSRWRRRRAPTSTTRQGRPDARRAGGTLREVAVLTRDDSAEPRLVAYVVPGSGAPHAILSVKPRGPYRLGGLCNGGLVAFEIARLLEARGEKVAIHHVPAG